MGNNNLMGSLSTAQLDTMLSRRYPDIVQIMKRVRMASGVNYGDKEMIEQQLISLCCALHSANKYELRLGTWRKGNVYSVERQRASEGPTIHNETIFTIVSSGERSCWGVYIDLPIKV